VCDLSLKHFYFIFRNVLSRAPRGVSGSHFFVARSHPRFIATCHCRFLASFLKWKRKLLSVNFATQLAAAHSLGMLWKFDKPYFRFCFVQVVTDWAMRVSCLVLTSQRSRDQNPGFSAADDAAARRVVFQINTFMYLRKMSMYQTNSVYVKLYSYCQCKWYLRLKISVRGPLTLHWSTASSVFRVGARGRAFTLSPPSPLSPFRPNKHPCFCGR